MNFTTNPEKKRKNRTEKILALLTLITLLFAFIVGFNRSLIDMTPYLPELLPKADRYEQTGFEKYTAFSKTSDSPIGFISVEKFNGFGGPMKVAIGVDITGTIAGIKVVENRETPSWFRKVMESPLIEALHGKSYLDHFEIGIDIDGVTGATYTTRAIVESVKVGYRDIAVKNLKLKKPAEKPAKLQFGFPEIVLIFLFAVGIFGMKYTSAKNKKRIRWISLLIGMVVIGFMINHPLTLVDINKFIMGYWPDLHHQLYWYLLILGIVLVFITTNKNVYCHSMCPFGAAQECLGFFGKAQGLQSRQYNNFFKWLRRAIVWFAVFVAFLFRNPGISSYEVYSTLFSLTGTMREVLFLVIVLGVSLFIKRPWCKYLCPVPAFEDFARFLKNWGKEFFGNQSKNHG